MILTKKINTTEKGIFKYEHYTGYFVPFFMDGKEQLKSLPTLKSAIAFKRYQDWISESTAAEAKRSLDEKYSKSKLISRGIHHRLSRSGASYWTVRYNDHYIGSYNSYSLAWISRYAFLKQHGLPPFPPNDKKIQRRPKGGLSKGNTSNYTGVWLLSGPRKKGHEWWGAFCKRFYIGRYKSPLLAHEARELFMRRYGVFPYPPNDNEIPYDAAEKSGYRGVYRFNEKWRAAVRCGRKKCNLGTFVCKHEAAMVVDMESLRLKLGPYKKLGKH